MPRLRTQPAVAPENAPPTPHEPRQGPTPARAGRGKPPTAVGPGHAPAASATPLAAAFAEPVCTLAVDDPHPGDGATGVPAEQPAVADRPAPGKKKQLPRRPPPLAGASAKEEGASSASSGRRPRAAPTARTPAGEAATINTAPSPAPKRAPTSQRPPRPFVAPAQPAVPAPVRAAANPQAQPGAARAAAPDPPDAAAAGPQPPRLPPEPPTPSPAKTYPAELREILQRGSAGDRSALPALKAAFDEHPELAARLGDVAKHAEQALLTLVGGENLTAREAITRQVAELRARLQGSAASELERLLVDRICVCWLEVYHADIDLAEHLLSHPGAAPAAQAAQKRLDRAHPRFLNAVKALATVRKLLKPPVAARPGRVRSRRRPGESRDRCQGT